MIGIACLSLIQIYWVSTLQFDYNFEALFPTDDPELAFFQEFRETFADDNAYLSVGVYHKAGIFDEVFLRKLDSCTKALEALDQVLQVNAPTTMKFLKFNVWGRKKQEPLLHIHKTERYKKDSSYIYRQPDLVHNFFSETRQALCIYLQITNNLAHTDAGEQLLQSIHNTLSSFQFDRYHVIGALQSQQANTKKVKAEFYLSSTLSFILVIIFLFTAFRAMWGVLVPLIVIGLCGLWTMGVIGGLGIPVNLMTMMIPTIVFVVAMSDVIHLLSKYLDELRLGKSQTAAMKVTLKEVGLATFLTSLTTSLGFLTLLTAGVKPFVQFGVFAAIGVMLSFFITFSVLPAILLQLPRPRLGEVAPKQLFWNHLLSSSFAGVLRKKVQIILGTLLLIGLALFGVNRLAIHAYFTDEIDADNPLSKDIQFFEQQFGGVRPFEVSVVLKDRSASVWDVDVLRQLNQVETYLSTDYQVHKLYSIIGVLKAANRSLMGGEGHFYRLPKSDQRLQKLVDQVKTFSDQNSLKNVITLDGQHARISGSIYDIGSIAVNERNQQLRAYIAEHIDTKRLDIKITGSATMIDRSHQIMSVNMLQGLTIALLVVSLFMGLLYRSLKAVVIALIPNVLPLLVIAGLMGWLGIGLKMSTSIIFTIAFGIAVDDTIHFMTKLNIELRKGLLLRRALKNTFISTGKAIILTSIMLSSGFFVMMLSDFNGTFYMGALVGVTLMLAVLADLLIIPILVVFLKLKRAKKDSDKTNT